MFGEVVDGEVTLLVCVHVDDLGVAVNDKEVFDAFYVKLQDAFPVNAMGDLSWYLGCAFERNEAKGIVKMAKTVFADSLVERFDIRYETQNPASVGFDLGPKRRDEKEGDWPYKEAVGGLLWISGVKRPGIASAARAVARHVHNPPARHWKAVRKVIAYLKGPEDL